MGGDTGDPEKVQRFTRGFEPLIKEGKAYAMVEMIREIETFEKENGTKRQIGLVIFSGDSNADAEAMKAARLLEGIRQGELLSVGIWVKGNTEQHRVADRSDIQVKGPSGNAVLLQGIADALRS